jgi:hypothetical protein
MHFATGVRTWRVARLYSEIALSRKPLGIGHVYIYNFLLRITDTMTSQYIQLSSWDTLYRMLQKYSVNVMFTIAPNRDKHVTMYYYKTDYCGVQAYVQFPQDDGWLDHA